MLSDSPNSINSNNNFSDEADSFRQQSKDCLHREVNSLKEILKTSVEKKIRVPSIDRATDLHPYSRGTALETLITTFDLSCHDRDLLLLCVGTEIDPEFSQIFSQLYADSSAKTVTLELVTHFFEGASTLDFIDLSSSLYHWSLICKGNGLLCLGELRIEEWTLQYLLGNYFIPFPFRGKLTPQPVHVNHTYVISDSHQHLIQQITIFWEQSRNWQNKDKILLQLCSKDPVTIETIAATVCEKQQLNLYKVDLAALSTVNSDTFQKWILYWHRRAKLEHEVLLVDCGDELIPNSAQESIVREIITTFTTPVILSCSDRIRNASVVIFEIPPLSPMEQRSLWSYHLGPDLAPQVEPVIDSIAVQFNLSAGSIQTICTAAQAEFRRSPESLRPQTIFNTLWQSCRSQSRAKLEGLVERKDSKTTWDELILNDEATLVLQQIIACVRNRAVVYSSWKMGGTSYRGMGVTALFHGPSGTGKTTAAEIIAQELQIDLYRVDLSQVSDKYIGETEKKLGKVFDVAESSGALLLFDEADSIIGKRSDVKDSKDRYANQTVGYLLQRMESYSGVAIMTTNLPNAIDSAFMRRIKYSIRFEYPNVDQRIKIWQKVFPSTVPCELMPPELLAQLNISGASIRNIALGSAFLACAENKAIAMEHVLKAARAEYQKLGRTISDKEIQGWSRYIQQPATAQ
jgi:hypothetical protein